MTVVSAVTSSPQIERALRSASQRTGADFDYLLKTAMRESNLKTDAKSKTSSAKGLFQFIEQTWFATLKKSGSEFGLGHVSKSIETLPDGTYRVANPATRSAILALRDDPRVSSLMAGAYTRDSAEKLQAAFGRTPRAGELYIAHFMGKNGAIDLISLAGRSPNAIAAHKFPQAADANKNIFYTNSGRPRTVKEVYQSLMSKHGAEPVQIARLKSNSTQGVSSIESDSHSVQFSSDKHLSSHFGGNKRSGFLAGLFGGGSVSGAKSQTILTKTLSPPQTHHAMSVMQKRPTQLLTGALSAASQSQQRNGARVHIASASVQAYQRQQDGAKVHNLFASRDLRGTFR